MLFYCLNPVQEVSEVQLKKLPVFPFNILFSLECQFCYLVVNWLLNIELDNSLCSNILCSNIVIC